jgi:hypothetical protein
MGRTRAAKLPGNGDEYKIDLPICCPAYFVGVEKAGEGMGLFSSEAKFRGACDEPVCEEFAGIGCVWYSDGIVSSRRGLDITNGGALLLSWI